MKIVSALIFGSVLGIASTSHAAILIEEGGKPVARTSRSIKGFKTAEDAMALRKLRRVGVGVQLAGPLGLAGVDLELNLSQENSFVGGYGGGPGYQAFTLQYKRVLGGANLLPYIAGGFSRWYSSGENPSPQAQATPSLLADRFLSDQERVSGKFNLNLIYPALGLQIVQPDGPWAGSSMYAELLMLMDVKDFVGAPTATIGYMYYF